jgi:phosphoglycolate phosphatase
LKQEGLPPLDLTSIKSCLGDGLRRLLIGVFRLSNLDLSEAEVNRLMPVFAEIYRGITPDPSCIYPGVLDLLKNCKACGIGLGLCTNKYEEATLRLVKQLGLDEFLSVIVGGDTVSESKPHPLPLQHALKQLGVTPENAAMVGDHRNDVLSARGAGMKVIGARYGYTKTWDADAQPDIFVDSAAEIGAQLPLLVSGF